MHGVLLVWRTVQLMHIKTEQEPPSGGADLVYISFHKFDMMYIQNLTLSKLIPEESRCDLLIY